MKKETRNIFFYTAASFAALLFIVLVPLYVLIENNEKTRSLKLKDESIDSLNNIIQSKDQEIQNLQDSICKRHALELFVGDYGLKHPDNLSALPDSIFFLMFSEAEKNHIPISIALNVIDRESGFLFIPNGEGSGAMGYFQVMPKTFSSLSARIGIKGHTPGNNIRVGSYYLRILHDHWKTRFSDEQVAWRHALAEFACGRGGMQILDDSGKVVGHHIPSSVEPGIQKAMKNY